MREELKELIQGSIEENPVPVINGITGRIANFEEIKIIESDKIVSFIDGGNATLLKAPNFIIAKLRVGIATFQNKKKLEEKTANYDLFAIFKGQWIVKINNEEIKIDDSSIKEFGRENIDRIPQIARRILELKTASNCASDYVVIDGTLDSLYSEDKKIIENLKRNVVGVSKTNSIRTTKGNSYTAMLQFNGPQTFVCKNILSHISFAKFFKGNYVFRIDGILTEELLSILKIHSKDPHFLGYPYGLVVADRIARISNEEARAAKINFVASLGKDFSKLRKYISALDAHEFLDMQNIY